MSVRRTAAVRVAVGSAYARTPQFISSVDVAKLGAKMVTLSRSLIILIDIFIYTKLNLCMEVDFCTPVGIDYQHAAKQLRWRADNTGGKHVVFRLNAFRQVFYLNLSPDVSFLAPLSREPRERASGELRQCFYSGEVNADPRSFAALSLCAGLRGIFAHNGTEYFISLSGSGDTPAAGINFAQTHVIRRRTRAHFSDGGAVASRCGVAAPAAANSINLSSDSLQKYKYMKDSEMGGLTETAMKTLGRSKRFASVPRFVEVLVVADDSMVKFHGDDLKHYLLTLMSVAARLYKHSSILNSINIVVVGFMVINEADKGPKVSSNAALTLRNFCSWQKKLNKHNDKHPDYWDTAILFTKQVRIRDVGFVPFIFECIHLGTIRVRNKKSEQVVAYFKRGSYTPAAQGLMMHA